MIARLLLAALVIIAIVWFVNNVKGKPPAQRRRAYVTLVLALTASALILLALTGRVHWIGAFIGALLPFVRQMAPLLLRFAPFLHHRYKATAASRGNSSGNSSAVDSAILRMVMDHDNGQLHGEVKQGPFAGMSLDALELEELRDLLAYCAQQDKDSEALLLSYLKHRFGAGWQQQPPPGAGRGDLSRADALAILGLGEGASREDIIAAHRRLMQKLHPDRGGNDYLASQINRAKDILLDE